MNEEGHGTTYRAAMYQSMKYPAGEWKPLNRRRKSDRWWYQAILNVGTIILCVAFWYALNSLEHLGRIK